jgi:uncharacterized protein (TIGR00730 family)
MPSKKSAPKARLFSSAHEDAQSARLHIDTAQCRSPSYRLAYQDQEFLLRDELRPVRLQLELLKPELILQENHIESTVVIFGSARIPDPETAEDRLVSAEAEYRRKKSDPALKEKVAIARRAMANSRYYAEARKLGALISSNTGKDMMVVITGGGAGIMEAANRGAHEVGIPSIGLNIVLPHEQAPNSYITPELSFQFHYFAIRKMHFLKRAKALVAFPGGFGTLDELFETLTLVQTQKVSPLPILLFGKEFWERVINFNVLVEEGTISIKDLELFQYVETADDAWEIISRVSA